MNAPIKILLALLVTGGLIYFTINLVAAEPQQALAQCYDNSSNNLDVIMQIPPESEEDSRKLCNDAFNEANTMRQCVNNVYAKYGQTQTAIARRLLNKNNTNPVDKTIEKHNQTCGAKYPETTIK